MLTLFATSTNSVTLLSHLLLLSASFLEAFPTADEDHMVIHLGGGGKEGGDDGMDGS